MFAGILWYSCAQIRPLKGGEKDTVSPIALSVYPPHLTTSFTSNQIVFNFDEYIQLNNITQELIISPPLQKQPKIRVKQKSLYITFDEELLPNTTYTFNFGDGVVDLNEGNKANDLIYVFSTGTAIDSLSLSGTVLDAYTLKPSAGFKVMLFESDTTISSKKPRPIYFAKTKTDGSYKINYLREGNFYLYGLNDENSNFRADEGEALALIGDSVSPTYEDSIKTILYSSVPRSNNPQVDTYSIDSTGYVNFKWDSYFDSLTVKPLNPDISVSLILERDSAFVRLKGKPTDRIEELAVLYGDELSDTISIPFFASAQKNSFVLNSNIEKKQLISSPLILSTPLWMHVDDTSQISLKQDSLIIQTKIIFSDEKNSCEIKAKLVSGKDYELIALPGAFSNESGGTNDTLNLKFTTYKQQELGSLKFVLSGDELPENAYFVLTNKEEKIIYSTNTFKSGALLIDNLPATDYTARFWQDDNQNKLFDPIILSTKQQPEKVWIFPQTISVRANWEVVLDWKIMK